MKVLSQPECHRVARWLMPTIRFGFKERWDWPTPLGKGFDPCNPDPVIYYRAVEDDGIDHLLISMHSERDYTDCVAADAVGIGEHEYDWEGALIRRIGNDWEIITVAHHKLPYHRVTMATGRPDIYRMEHSHAIYPTFKELRNPMLITHPKLIWLDGMVGKLAGWEKVFNPQVNSPRQWADGLMWTNPAKLFEEMRDK